MKALLALVLLSGTLVASPCLSAVDLNTAPRSELESLRGVGPAKAQAILDYRAAHGGFKSIDELDAVRGFGKTTIEKLRPDLSLTPQKRR